MLIPWWNRSRAVTNTIHPFQLPHAKTKACQADPSWVLSVFSCEKNSRISFVGFRNKKKVFSMAFHVGFFKASKASYSGFTLLLERFTVKGTRSFVARKFYRVGTGQQLCHGSSTLHPLWSTFESWRIWLWVKKRYLKNPIGKGKIDPSTCSRLKAKVTRNPMGPSVAPSMAYLRRCPQHLKRVFETKGKARELWNSSSPLGTLIPNPLLPAHLVQFFHGCSSS